MSSFSFVGNKSGSTYSFQECGLIEHGDAGYYGLIRRVRRDDVLGGAQAMVAKELFPGKNQPLVYNPALQFSSSFLSQTCEMVRDAIRDRKSEDEQICKEHIVLLHTPASNNIVAAIRDVYPPHLLRPLNLQQCADIYGLPLEEEQEGASTARVDSSCKTLNTRAVSKDLVDMIVHAACSKASTTTAATTATTTTNVAAAISHNNTRNFCTSTTTTTTTTTSSSSSTTGDHSNDDNDNEEDVDEDGRQCCLHQAACTTTSSCCSDASSSSCSSSATVTQHPQAHLSMILHPTPILTPTPTPIITPCFESFPLPQTWMSFLQKRARVRREIWAMLAMPEHPNLMQMIDYGESVRGNTLRTFMVLPFYRNGDLMDRLNQNKVSPVQAVEFFSQIVNAVKVMHDVGLCHRDLKLDNILVSDDGQSVVVADMGFVTTTTTTTTTTMRLLHPCIA